MYGSPSLETWVCTDNVKSPVTACSRIASSRRVSGSKLHVARPVALTAVTLISSGTSSFKALSSPCAIWYRTWCVRSATPEPIEANVFTSLKNTTSSSFVFRTRGRHEKAADRTGPNTASAVVVSLVSLLRNNTARSARISMPASGSTSDRRLRMLSSIGTAVSQRPSVSVTGVRN